MIAAWRDPRAWAPAVVAAACLLGLGMAAIDPVRRSTSVVATPHEPVLHEQARALLGGLREGERIMGWTVTALDGPTEGLLRIDLARDDVRFALTVAAKGTRAESSLVETERHAIFYGHVHPPEVSLPDGTIRATTHALARRIRDNEATVEVPGL